MRRYLAIIALLCAANWVYSAPSAVAQVRGSSGYPNNTLQPTTVSPYLNLSVDANGVSNYQSLVRPLLNQREVLAQQAAGRPHLHAPPTGSPNAAAGVDLQPAGAGQRRAAGHFMNFSHYYGSPR